jgi:hypothetical protein
MLLLGAVAIAAVVACSDNRSVGTALNLGHHSGTVCVPAPKNDDVIFGDTLLRQEADDRVTISDVSLVNAEGMALRDSYLVQIRPGEALVGFRLASDQAQMPANWNARVPAEGSVLEPGSEWNLVLVIDSPPHVTASADAARVRYRHEDQDRTQDTRTSMMTAESCDDLF